MNTITWKVSDKKLVFTVSGRIDSASAEEMERILSEGCASCPELPVVLDFDRLEMITSAGLRVVLRLERRRKGSRIINVHPEVYEVLEMTGFTELLEVTRAYRIISVAGCEVIGRGANSYVCRIDPETIVKVYLHSDSLEEIQRERHLARTAFVMGIPTAISYDVVRIQEGGYGAVFELLNAESCASLLASGARSEEEIARLSADMLHLIHGTVAEPGTLPDIRERAALWSGFLRDVLPQDQYIKLNALLDAVPEDPHVLHGDFHLRNIMIQNGEALLIDMDTLSHGHPIFELAGMFMAYQGFYAADHSGANRFLGISWETASRLWQRILSLYLNTDNESVLRSIEDRAKVIAYARILRRTLRRSGDQEKEGQALIGICRNELTELLPRIDTLTF